MPSLLRNPFRRSATRATDDDEPATSDSAAVPRLDYANNEQSIESDRACMVMAKHLSISLRRHLVDISLDSGAAVRIASNDYAIHPSLEEEPTLTAFAIALHKLDVDVAFCFSSDMVRAITDSLEPNQHLINVADNLHVQVVDTMRELASARAAQRACFIRSEGKVVLWGDDPEAFQKFVESFCEKMMIYIWQHSNSVANKVKRMGSPALSPSTAGRRNSYFLPPQTPTSYRGAASPTLTLEGFEDKSVLELGLEKPAGVEVRTSPIQGALLSGASVGLAVIITSLTVRAALNEYFLDEDVMHFPILAACPFMFMVVLFFSQSIIGNIAQIIAPTHYTRNSQYYSGKKPVRRQLEFLPHMTIVIPVYKESLAEVVAPSIESINTAIRTYELQGGTANLIVCDDGLQLVDEEERAIRIEYYTRRGAAYVARPKENRAGRFKKSSNLNTMHALSLRIEVLMNERRPENLSLWTSDNEVALHDACLLIALEEREGKVWASGNLRHGEYILLVDSDTRIPEDCFLDAAMEMEASPEIAILQYCSGTFLAGSGFFETGIAYFTKIVNFSISVSVSNGLVAPFMGHNAFLRWAALQEQALTNPNGLVWSEEHVSEDFVMTMAVIEAGYTVRWATYTEGFLEGVSLSAADELNRWQKYAFGVSEVSANPIRYWPMRSPMSKLFRRYLWGPAPLSAKWATVSYLFSYLALAIGAPLTIGLYFVAGLFEDTLDNIYRPMFSQFIGLIFVFAISNNVATIVSRFRTRHATFWGAIKEGFIWLPFLAVFFSGLSLHVCTGLLAHLFSYNMTWTATEKEVTQSTIWKELPAIGKRFWVMFTVFVPFVAAVIVFTTPVIPLEWRIEQFSIIFPAIWISAGHLLFPFLLNPWVVTLSY